MRAAFRGPHPAQVRIHCIAAKALGSAGLAEKDMEGRRRGRFPSKEELELWAKVTRRDEPLARRRRAARHDPAPESAAAAIPPKPAESPPREEAAPAQPAVKPNGIRQEQACRAAAAPAVRPQGRQAHRTRPARDRREARSSRHAPERRTCRAAPLPRPLPGGGPPPCAHHHRQRHKPRSRSETAISGPRSSAACSGASCRIGCASLRCACMS